MFKNPLLSYGVGVTVLVMGTSAKTPLRVETLIVARVDELPVGSWPTSTPRWRVERELNSSLAGVCPPGTVIKIRREAVYDGVL